MITFHYVILYLLGVNSMILVSSYTFQECAMDMKIVMILAITSVASIAPMADASVVGIEWSFIISTISEDRLLNIWWWPVALGSIRISSNWCLEPTKIWIVLTGEGLLLDGDVAVGVAAGCPTEEEVTCKMEAAELEKIAPQSVVGDSSGLVGLKNIKLNRCHCHDYRVYSILDS